LKILFLHSGKVDYLQDALYQGFVNVVGAQNIQAYRWYKRYHLPIYQHPKNLGFVGFKLPCPRVDKDSIGQFSLIVIASCKRSTFIDYLEIAPHISKGAKVIFLDGGDAPEIGGDLAREGSKHLFLDAMAIRPVDLVFKREMLIDRTYASNVFPINFAVSLNALTLTPRPKLFDVVFWAVESHPIRTKVLSVLESHFDCKSNGSVPRKDFRMHNRKGRDYLKGLLESRITLNYRGAGWDTLRYWEVTAMGQLLISQKPEIIIPNNFENMKSIVFVGEDPSEMIDVCRYFLKKPIEAETIGRAAVNHSRQFHTPKHRAIYILEKSQAGQSKARSLFSKTVYV
jgi:hypothetical protein